MRLLLLYAKVYEYRRVNMIKKKQVFFRDIPRDKAHGSVKCCFMLTNIVKINRKRAFLRVAII